MRVRIVGAFDLVLVAMVVAACNGGDQPSTLPDATSASPTALATASASPTPIGDPTAQLEAEITEFYKLYVETINESWTSEEALQRRREMFADTCSVCLAGYELTQRALQQGLIFGAKPATIRSARLDNVDGDVVTFLGVEDVPAARLLNSEGDVVDQFGATIGAQVAYRVQRTREGTWVIIASDLLSVEGGG
jgi:hypothetical protein